MFEPTVVGSLLFVSSTDIIESCWCSVIAFDGSTRKAKSLCVHPTFLTLRTSNTPWFSLVQETCAFHRFMSPSTNAISMNREDLLMRSVQVTPVLQEGNISRRTTSNSLPALPSVPSDHLYDTVEITNPTTVQVDLQAGAIP